VANAARIEPGSAVLDVGCGTGRFCELAAERGAIVHGLDADPAAIAQAQRRVAAGDFRLGLMEDLPWADRSFDVVTSFNTFQYALDVDLALAEAGRVARDEGRIAICKWGPPEQNEFFTFLASLDAAHVRIDELPETDPVERAIHRSRLRVLVTGDAPAPIEIANESALDAALSAAGALAGPDDPLLQQRVSSAAAPFRRRDGRYVFKNRLKYWIAHP
jgi:SAM-dependent methyltransferase